MVPVKLWYWLSWKIFRLACLNDNESYLDINSNLTAFDRLSSDVDCQSDVATVATVQSESKNYVGGGLMTSVRSRAGRLIRPVVRLIETMQEQKIDNQVNTLVWISMCHFLLLLLL